MAGKAMATINPRQMDPATLGYPPTLPVEIALRTVPLPQIREAYGFTPDEWDELQYDPVFRADLARAVEMVKKDGMSFKLKARLQAEELLTKSWQMIHDPSDKVPAKVKADLLQFTIRCAGYSEGEKTQGAVGTALQININLGT